MFHVWLCVVYMGINDNVSHYVLQYGNGNQTKLFAREFYILKWFEVNFKKTSVSVRKDVGLFFSFTLSWKCVEYCFAGIYLTR